ncbi:MAG: two-component regulator propeller domain-containing protein [Bacteroidota bacterium]|nr:two-component regulator propeller domain-containing protein [Bacteroidota bacterium]
MIFCIIPFPGWGQKPVITSDLNVTVYNVEQGLSQSYVNQVMQDKKGLIWLATGGGLQSFDGISFRDFILPKNLSSNPYGHTIQDIVEEEPGNLILSTGSSVLRFCRKSGRFMMIEHRAVQYSKILRQSWENRPLCWMSSDGLCLVNDNRLYPVTLHFSPGNKLPDSFIPQKSIQTPESHILISGDNGYLDLNPGKTMNAGMKAKWVPLKNPCDFICTDPKGNVYLLSRGVIFSLSVKGVLKQVFNTGIKESSSLFIDRLNNFWIADKTHKRLFRIYQGQLSEIRFMIHKGKLTDEIKPVITDIFEDNAGNLWFGTDGNGLLFMSKRQLTFDLSGIGFTRCMEYFAGEIWAGTFKNGLWRLSPDLRKSRCINTGSYNDDLYYFDLVTDKSGRLWAATNKGIFIYNNQGFVVFHYPFKTLSAIFLKLPGNRLLLSTYSKLYSCQTGKSPGISFIRDQTQIRDLIVFRDAYWVGNHFGLYRKDTAAGLLEALSFNDNDRISNVPVYSLLPSGLTVFAGTENGIECYSSSGKKRMLFPYLRELRQEIVYSLLTDGQNRIWFSSNHGIGCISPNHDRVIRFDTRNNLQSSEFNYNAKLVIPDGNIYFGGINGINGLNPEKLVINQPSPDIRLISLSISDSNYTQGLPSEGEILKIHWKSAHFSGTVFNPEYLPSGTIEYSFFLEGYDDQWGKPSPDASFSYRNLPPGEYSLWGRCIDSYKNQGQARLLLKIIIRPPFWKTWIFAVISGILLVVFLILVIRKIQEIKNRNLIKELERRNAVDRERLRISQDMHDEIGASLTQIAILSEIVKKQKENPDEMMKSIDQISGISGTVVDDMSEIIWAMNPKNNNLASFVSYLRQHASEYLATAEINGNFKFPEKCPSIPMTSEQNRNIFLVVKEALHNAVKHSDAREVDVSLSYIENCLSVSIKDDGKGFQVETADDKGNGLTTMRKRIENLEGFYSITSVPGEGTKVEFSVFLNN